MFGAVHVRSVSIYAWHTCMHACMYVCTHGCISNKRLYLCICYAHVLAQKKEQSEAINLVSDPISCGWLCSVVFSLTAGASCTTPTPVCPLVYLLPPPLPICPLCISPPHLFSTTCLPLTCPYLTCPPVSAPPPVPPNLSQIDDSSD